MFGGKTRKFAGVLASLAMGVSLLGTGVFASFTDSATATDKISVGTFGIQIASSSTPGAVISADKKSITLDTSAAPLQSSATASQPLQFTVKNTGAIPVAHLTVTASSKVDGVTAALPSPFTDSLPAAGDVTLASNATKDYAGGLAWTELGNANLGHSVSLTYMVNAVN